MQAAQTNLFNRSDTLLGVCQGIGEDLGFNPNYLRVLLGVGVLWNPMAMIGIYLALGVVVAVTRLLVPARRRQAEAPPVEQAPQHENDDSEIVLAEAA